MAHVQSIAPAFPRLAIAAAIVLSFKDQRRYRVRLAILIDRHKSNVSAAGVLALAGKNVFREHLHAHFH